MAGDRSNAEEGSMRAPPPPLEGAKIRAFAARLRDQAAASRLTAAQLREEAARARDQAARVRDEAASTRDEASRQFEALLQQRLATAPPGAPAAWIEVIERLFTATENSRQASVHDRDAARLERDAAEKDRKAAERDHEAAHSDRLAADKDREAADEEHAAVERQAEALENAPHFGHAPLLSTLGRISAGIAHELNNPLAALQSNLAVLETQQAGGPAAHAGDVIGDLRVSTERIARVVQDLKGWVRLESAESQRAPVELARVLEDVVASAAGQLPGRPAVSVKVEPLPPVWGVVHRLREVFLNLLISAAHAMPEGRGGNEIRIRAFAEGDLVTVEVRDNGLGIAPEVLPHVFDPFFAVREGQGGTGLGLALCQHVVTDHGGTLSVESTPGEGSTFRVVLPAGPGVTPGAVSPTAPRRPRVLLIDDDVALVRGLKRQLARRAEVTVAVNGKEGLERLLAPGEGYELVLCDLSMPVMNGRQLYEQLLKQAPHLAARVVFITGGALSHDTEQFLAALPNTKLFKPFTSRALFELLDARVGASPTDTSAGASPRT